MKTLITADDVAAKAKCNEKVLHVPPDSIITPAAWDTAKERGIQIVNDAAVTQVRADMQPAASGVDFALVSQIVAEVLVSLNIGGIQRQQAKEADPSGLCLIRSNQAVLESPTGKQASHNGQRQNLPLLPESPVLAAGLAAIETASITADIPQDEINYIIAGSVTVTIHGRKYAANSGDVLFIPAGSQVTYTTQDSARWFYVTYRRHR